MSRQGGRTRSKVSDERASIDQRVAYRLLRLSGVVAAGVGVAPVSRTRRSYDHCGRGLRARVEVKRFAFIIVSVVLGLVICEGALRLSARYSPFLSSQLRPPQTRNLLPDRVLKFRMSPYAPGHDRRGYRNEVALQQADVLALGDSWTYGLGAHADGTWPHQLQVPSERSVHSAGVGGYGPCEYLGVLDELASLRPATVLAGLYLGNDIGDAYASVYLLRRCSNLATSDRAVLRAMAEADRSSTLRELGTQLGDVRADPPGPAERTALGRLFRAVHYQLATRDLLPNRKGRPATFEAGASQPFRVPVDSPRASRTVFRDPHLDALAVDVDDPRMAEGLRITFAALEQIRLKAASPAMRWQRALRSLRSSRGARDRCRCPAASSSSPSFRDRGPGFSSRCGGVQRTKTAVLRSPGAQTGAPTRTEVCATTPKGTVTGISTYHRRGRMGELAAQLRSSADSNDAFGIPRPGTSGRLGATAHRCGGAYGPVQCQQRPGHRRHVAAPVPHTPGSRHRLDTRHPRWRVGESYNWGEPFSTESRKIRHLGCWHRRCSSNSRKHTGLPRLS